MLEAPVLERMELTRRQIPSGDPRVRMVFGSGAQWATISSIASNMTPRSGCDGLRCRRGCGSSSARTVSCAGERDPQGRFGFFRATRPAAEMTRFIKTHRERFGVEPICRELQVAPSSYYVARSRAGA